MHPVDKAMNDIVLSFIDILGPDDLKSLRNALAELADYIKGKRTDIK